MMPKLATAAVIAALTAWSSGAPAQTRLIFVANPNNPTGTIVSNEKLANFIDAVRENILLALDEAYTGFVTRLLPCAVTGG